MISQTEVDKHVKDLFDSIGTAKVAAQYLLQHLADGDISTQEELAERLKSKWTIQDVERNLDYIKLRENAILNIFKPLL